MAHKIDEFPVFQEAQAFVSAVTAIRALEPKADSIGRQIGGLVKYLKMSGFKDRGRFKASQLRSR
jgi:hypothetical protein